MTHFRSLSKSSRIRDGIRKLARAHLGRRSKRLQHVMRLRCTNTSRPLQLRQQLLSGPRSLPKCCVGFGSKRPTASARFSRVPLQTPGLGLDRGSAARPHLSRRRTAESELPPCLCLHESQRWPLWPLHSAASWRCHKSRIHLGHLREPRWSSTQRDHCMGPGAPARA